MFPPNKKSGILGIGPKAPRENAPPPYAGAESPAEEAAESGGIACPACGAQLQLTPVEMPEETAEMPAGPPMEQAS